ncbi:MAG: hypothetical protein H5U40_03845 [Polyangiaceae bacterium]|nr:hypothetical protein [Polyangiaceae bacterium]
MAGAACFVVLAAPYGALFTFSALATLASLVPFFGLVGLLVGAVFVAPFTRATERLESGRSHDGLHGLVVTSATVVTMAVVPVLIFAGWAAALGWVAGLALGASGLGCLWVVADHVSTHRLVARARAGKLGQYQLRAPVGAERQTLPRLFSEYGEDAPLETLVRVAAPSRGAYREAPILEPLALVPRPEARPSSRSPASNAAIVSTLQGLLLLIYWSIGGG